MLHLYFYIHSQWYTGDDKEVRRLLMMDGALINATDEEGNTPLMLAVTAGDNMLQIH